MPKKGLNIYHRKDGRLEGTYYYGLNPKTGKRKNLSRYGHTEKEAKEKLLTAISQIKTGTYIEKNKLTLEAWLVKWLDVYAKPKVKQSTYVSYSTYVNKHISPGIGRIKLVDLRVDILQEFFNQKAEDGRLDGQGGLSEKTLRNIYTMLSTALKQAYVNGLINKNLVEFVQLPKVVKKEMRVLSISEQKELINVLKLVKNDIKLVY